MCSKFTYLAEEKALSSASLKKRFFTEKLNAVFSAFPVMLSIVEQGQKIHNICFQRDKKQIFIFKTILNNPKLGLVTV